MSKRLNLFFKFFLLTLQSQTYANSISWIGSVNDDMTNGGNWSPATVPTASDTAYFSSASLIKTPQVPSPSIADFSVLGFNFANNVAITATMNGPYSLNFTGGGITGTSSHSIIEAINTGTMTSLQQILFANSHSIPTSVGSATFNILNSGVLTNGGSINDLAQILFDGSGGESLAAGGIGYLAVTLNGSSSITATNDNTITNTENANDMAQILFDGSGGESASAAGSGTMIVAIGDNAALTAINSGGSVLSAISNDFYQNDVGQIVFDGSGGLSTAEGGMGHSTVTINGNAVLSAINNGTISDEVQHNGVNNLGQILFDGSAGFGLGGYGVGYSNVTLGGNAVLRATNAQSIFNHADSSGVNDIAQILFDGSGGFSNDSGGQGFSSVSISGHVNLNAANELGASIANYDGTMLSTRVTANNLGQILFDGSGGFGNTTTGLGSSVVNIGDSTTLATVNDGSIYNTSFGYANDLAQISFNGSGGLSFVDSGQRGGIGSSTVTIGNSVVLSAINTGSIYNTDHSVTNDLAQVLFDGSGGINFVGRGTGRSAVTIGSNVTVNAVNSGSITVATASTSNDVAQILFDGSSGNKAGSFRSHGLLNAVINANTTFSAANSGTISNTATANGVAQILFDGRSNISGSTGVCKVTFKGTSSVIALNEASGTVTGDQIAFYNANIFGKPILQATNQGAVTHGIAFYGATTTADHVNIVLDATSLWIDSTLNSTFTIGSLTGNGSSQVLLNQSLNIDTAPGAYTTFNGVISNFSGNSNNIRISGSGTQVFGGASTYPRDTEINGGTLIVNGSLAGALTLVNSGGTLRGTGTVQSIIVNTSGKLAPGNLLGTFHSGSVTFNSGAIFQVEMNPSTASKLESTGTAILGGAAVRVVQETGSYPRSGKYLILDAAAISGAFASPVKGGLLIGGFPGYQFNVKQVDDTILLSYRSAIPTINLSGNAKKIANLLNAQDNGTIISYLNGTSPEGLQSALNSISSSRNAFPTYIAAQTAFSLSGFVSTHLENFRIAKNTSAGNNFETALLVDASTCCKVHCCPPKSQSSLWIGGFGALSHQSSADQNPSFNFNTGSVLLGADYFGCDWGLLGASFGYARTHYYENKNVGEGNISYFFGSLYGNYFIENYYLSPAVWVFFTKTGNTRHIATPGFSATALATINAWQLVPHLEFGYQIERDWGTISPFTSLDWAISWQESYTESGAGSLNTHQSSHTSSIFRSETGFKASERWGYCWGAFYLKEKLAYVFENPLNTGKITTAFVGLPGSMTLIAVNQNLNLFSGGLDFLFEIGNARPTNVNFGYKVEVGSNFWTNQFLLSVDKNF